MEIDTLRVPRELVVSGSPDAIEAAVREAVVERLSGQVATDVSEALVDEPLRIERPSRPSWSPRAPEPGSVSGDRP